MDWTTMEKAGIAGVAIFALWCGLQMCKLMMNQWKSSTETVGKNTEAFIQLSNVFEKQAERELEFQRETTALLKSGIETGQDTNRKVTEIHIKLTK